MAPHATNIRSVRHSSRHSSKARPPQNTSTAQMNTHARTRAHTHTHTHTHTHWNARIIAVVAWASVSFRWLRAQWPKLQSHMHTCNRWWASISSSAAIKQQQTTPTPNSILLCNCFLPRLPPPSQRLTYKGVDAALSSIVALSDRRTRQVVARCSRWLCTTAAHSSQQCQARAPCCSGSKSTLADSSTGIKPHLPCSRCCTR